MADSIDIHKILKAYMKIVAKADGAVLLDPGLVSQFNTVIARPNDEKAHKKLQELLDKQVRALKTAKNIEAAAELELVGKATKLVDEDGDKMTDVLSRIKPEPKEDKNSKPAKLHGTGNKIVSVAKAQPFKPEAEQGDLSLRSVMLNLATNPDLSMKAADDDKKPMEDDRTRWGVARLTGSMVFPEDNAEEFTAAAPGTIWLGYVRIGRRVEKTEDRIVLVQLTPEKDEGRRYQTRPKALVVGQTWHNVWMNKQFAAKPDPSIKKWNGWTLQDLKTDKRVDLTDTGCFFGFFLVKAKEGGTDHYWNFRCASINKPANSFVSDYVPELPRGKMTPDQRSMYQNMLTAARGNHAIPKTEIEAHFGRNLHRGTLGLDEASKKMPLSWAKAVFEVISKLPSK